MNFLKQSTASQSVLIGPFLDEDDGKTAETGLTISNTDIRLSKNGGNMAAKNSGGGTHDELGWYTITLDATDTDTVGRLQVIVHESGALPVLVVFQVLEEAIYDALFAASADGFDANGRVDVASIEGSDATDQIRDAVVSDSVRVDAGNLNSFTGLSNLGLLSINGSGAVDSMVQGYVASALSETSSGTIAGNQSTFWDNDGDPSSTKVVDDVGGGGGGGGLTALLTGQAQSGASGSITLATGASSTNDYFNKTRIVTTTGTGAGQSRAVTDYNGTTKVATVSPNWTTAPDGTTFYEIQASDANLLAATQTSIDDILTDTGTTLPATLATIDGIVDDILVDTGTTLPTTLATIDGIVDDILVDTGTTLSAAIAVIDLNVDQIETAVITNAAGADIAADIIALKAETVLIVADTGELQTDWVNGGRLDLIVDAILADTAQIGTAGAGLTNVPWNSSWDAEVQSEVDDGLKALGLDHLVSASVAGGDVADDSIFAFLVSASATADWDDFVNTTDSLQALRDRGDAAWTTGAGGSDRLIMADTTIATLASQTSFTLTAGSADDDAYNGCTIVIEDASTAVQKARGIVDDYTGSSKTITLLEDPGVFTIAATDKVYILAESSLKPTTVQDYHVDVTSGGNVGIDWGNVANPTTTLDLSGTDIQLCDTVTTVTTLTGHTAQTGDTYALANGSAGFVAIDTVVDSILDDTAVIGAAGAGLTDLGGMSTGMKAEVNAEADTALSDYDGPTKAEMDTAHGLLATEAKQDLMDTNVDAIKVATDKMVFTTSNQLDVQVISMATNSLTASAAAADFIGASEIAASAATEIADLIAADWIAGDASPLAIVAALKADAEWSNLATIDANVDLILVDTGTTLDGKLDTIDTNVDQIETAVITNAAGVDIAADIIALKAETALIVADTNELQVDDIPGTIAALNNISTAQVNTEVDNSMVTYGLDHIFSASIAGSDVTDNSFAAKLVSKESTADWDDYVNTTDALQAIRDRGDSAWTTGGSDRLVMVDTTIATLASQTSFTLTAGSADDDAYNGLTIVIEDASTSTQKAAGIVDDYTGGSRTVTLLEDPTIFTMAATDKVYILAERGVKPTVYQDYHMGLSDGGRPGIEWGNIANQSATNALTNPTVGTVTTLTGHTAQTGDNTAVIGAAGAGLTDLGGMSTGMKAEVNTEADSAIVTYGLDHLVFTSVAGSDVADNSIIASLTSSSATADWDDFVNTTDSLQALRDNQGGGGGGLTALASGTAQSGTASTIVLAAASSFADDELNWNVVNITSGTGAGQSRMISDYTGSTDTATVTPDWTTNPTSSSVYEVVQGAGNAIQALTVTTQTELAGVPAAAATVADMMGWVFMLSRNKLLQTATVQTLRNDADGANVAVAATVDDGVTFTRSEFI